MFLHAHAQDHTANMSRDPENLVCLGNGEKASTVHPMQQLHAVETWRAQRQSH
jgi:hypothetical protein